MRLLSLIKKEFRQFRRDRRMVVMSVLPPLIQLAMLGYAANLDVIDLPVAVCDLDRSAQSRRLVAEIEQAGYFVIAGRTTRSEELMVWLDGGRAQLAVEIPYGFQQDLREGRAVVQMLVDGSDSNSAGIGAGYLSRLIAQHGVRSVRQQVSRRGLALSDPVELRTRALYNPDLRSVYFMVPGVLGLVLMVMTGVLTALAIVKEREIGTLEQLMVTPIRPAELIVGKMIPYCVIGLVNLALVLAVMLLWFRVPLRGDLAFLAGAAFLFILTCLGLGLLTSSVSSTQQQAQMTIFLLLFPSVLLSGFMFPIASMPVWMQYLTYAIPLRYFLTIIRSVMLKGSGLVELWPETAALAVFAVGLLALGALSFRKRL